MNFAGIAVCLATLLFGISTTCAQQPLREGVVEPLNIQASFQAGPGNDPVQWSRTEERLGAKYIRIHFTDIQDRGGTDYRVVVRDRNNRVVVDLSPQAFAAEPDLWTQTIDGDYVRIEVVASQKPDGLQFLLRELAYQQNMGAPFSISLPDEREAVRVYRDSPILKDRIHPVAKLTFVTDGMILSCTGFLIDGDRFLTNEHCINSKVLCRTAIATFDYETMESGSVNVGRQYPCAQFIDADQRLDVSLLRLAGAPGSVHGFLPLNGRPIVLGEQAYMIQHPAGEPKQISRKGCSVTTVSAAGNGVNTDFGHKCDTLGGSSGSPVLGADFTVIGLHHLGFDGTDMSWRAENRGVRMDQIISWIQGR